MKGYNLCLLTPLHEPSPGSSVVTPSAPIPHKILTTNMPTLEEGRVAWGQWMEGKDEDKTQRKMQNLGNDRERILAEFPCLVFHFFKSSPYIPFYIRKRWLFCLGKGYKG
jgi:hypothetical protein